MKSIFQILFILLLVITFISQNYLLNFNVIFTRKNDFWLSSQLQMRCKFSSTRNSAGLSYLSSFFKEAIVRDVLVSKFQISVETLKTIIRNPVFMMLGLSE